MKALREAPIEVPWLGTLCADWPLVPLRYLVRFLSGGTPDKGNADFWSDGTIPWVSPKDMKVDRINDSEDHITVAALDGSATQLVPVGSVLIVVRGMILAHTLPIAVTTGPVTINQDIKALVCGQRILPEFLHAVLAGQAEWLLSQADSSAHGTKKLETEVLQRFEVPCPPLALQRRVVATLRAQATSLDEVVAAKQRVLDLLAEKRKAIITTAVTRGLEPEVKLRDSGVPWLGWIPAHWRAFPIKFGFSRTGSGTTPPSGDAQYYGGDVPWITTSELRENDICESSQSVSQLAVSEFSALKLYPPRTVLFAMYGATIGRVAMLRIDATVNQAVCALAEAIEWEPEFAFFSLQASREALIAEASGGGQPNLNAEKVRNHALACPPLAEQRAIVEHIEHETAKLDAVRAASERTIALLKERRSALIAAAVTGQLDVGVTA